VLFLGEFYKHHGRDMFHSSVAIANQQHQLRHEIINNSNNNINADTTVEPISSSPVTTNLDGSESAAEPGSPIASNVKDSDIERAAAQLSRKNTFTASIVSTVVYILFRIAITIAIAVLIQALFNFGILFFNRERLGLNYGGVIWYEWNSRSFLCPMWATQNGLANKLQVMSILF
jgi:hypothetical protein